MVMAVPSRGSVGEMCVCTYVYVDGWIDVSLLF